MWSNWVHRRLNWNFSRKNAAVYVIAGRLLCRRKCTSGLFSPEFVPAIWLDLRCRRVQKKKKKKNQCHLCHGWEYPKLRRKKSCCRTLSKMLSRSVFLNTNTHTHTHAGRPFVTSSEADKIKDVEKRKKKIRLLWWWYTFAIVLHMINNIYYVISDLVPTWLHILTRLPLNLWLIGVKSLQWHESQVRTRLN